MRHNSDNEIEMDSEMDTKREDRLVSSIQTTFDIPNECALEIITPLYQSDYLRGIKSDHLDDADEKELQEGYILLCSENVPACFCYLFDDESDTTFGIHFDFEDLKTDEALKKALPVFYRHVREKFKSVEEYLKFVNSHLKDPNLSMDIKHRRKYLKKFFK